MNIRLVLVDDHRLLREGLRALLDSAQGVTVVGEAADGRTALDLVRSLIPDVVVMDIGMAGLNGVEATRRIRAEHPSVKIVALSTHTGRRYVHQMLDAGASAYVIRMAAYEEMLRAVRAVGVGRTYLCSEIAGFVVERSLSAGGAGGPARVKRLGPREREVLQLDAEGRTSSEAERAMHISTKTVETHRRNISATLDLHGTADLTKFATLEGLTSLEA